MIWGPVVAVTQVMDESGEHREESSDQWDPGWPGAAGERGRVSSLQSEMVITVRDGHQSCNNAASTLKL